MNEKIIYCSTSNRNQINGGYIGGKAKPNLQAHLTKWCCVVYFQVSLLNPHSICLFIYLKKAYLH